MVDLVQRRDDPNLRMFDTDAAAASLGYDEDEDLTPDGGHFTPELHRAVGEAMAAVILEWAALQPHLAATARRDVIEGSLTCASCSSTAGCSPTRTSASASWPRLGNDLLVVYPEAMDHYPFETAGWVDYGQSVVWKGEPPPPAELVRIVEDFAPDAIVMRAWNGRSYRAVVRAMRGKALRIMFSSTDWRSTARQWAGRLTHRWYIDPLFDAAFVPGERSEFFVRRLGFRGEDIIRGANSADVALFERGPRTGEELLAHRRFVFSGRLVWHKAIDVLAEAYGQYRRTASTTRGCSPSPARDRSPPTWARCPGPSCWASGSRAPWPT